MIAVESTTLATVGYDDAREFSQLEFRSRANYRYFEVPVAVHQNLLDAPSKGSYFNQVHSWTLSVLLDRKCGRRPTCESLQVRGGPVHGPHGGNFTAR